MTQVRLDDLHVARKERGGVEDATLILLNLILRHLEANKKHARLLFIDFSSLDTTPHPCI